MISIDNLLLFISAGLLLNITPGPDMIYIATRSSAQGKKAGVLSALGIGAGAILHLIAAAFGLSAILMYSAEAYQIIKWVGAAYLIYLGIKTILSSNKKISTEKMNKDPLSKIFFQGAFTNILNPKVALFFLAFLPQFVDSSTGNITFQILLLGFIFNFNGTLINLMVALFFAKIGGLLNRSTRIQKIQSWFTGTVFIGLGVSLVLSNRK